MASLDGMQRLRPRGLRWGCLSLNFVQLESTNFIICCKQRAMTDPLPPPDQENDVFPSCPLGLPALLKSTCHLVWPFLEFQTKRQTSSCLDHIRLSRWDIVCKVWNGNGAAKADMCMGLPTPTMLQGWKAVGLPTPTILQSWLALVWIGVAYTNNVARLDGSGVAYTYKLAKLAGIGMDWCCLHLAHFPCMAMGHGEECGWARDDFWQRHKQTQKKHLEKALGWGHTFLARLSWP